MKNFRTIVGVSVAVLVMGAGMAQGRGRVEPPAATAPKVEAPKDEKPAEQKLSYVELDTSKGKIVLELDGVKAPISTANFLAYVNKGYYAGTIFHRVINNFMIQGGGFDGSMQQKATEKPIKNEWKNGLKNKKYTVAMARTAVADSATSQFYINVVDNDMLDQPRDGAGYAVFGKVIAGFEVVDAIKVVKTKPGDVPVEQVTITSVKVVTKEEAEKASKPAEKAPAAGGEEKKVEEQKGEPKPK